MFHKQTKPTIRIFSSQSLLKARMELKLGWLRHDAEVFTRAYADQTAPFYNRYWLGTINLMTSDLGNIIAEAEMINDYPLTKEVFIASKTLFQHRLNIYTQALNFTEALSIPNPTHVLDFRYQIMMASFQVIDIFPTTPDHVSSALTNIAVFKKKWGDFHEAYKKGVQRIDTFEALLPLFETILSNKIAHIYANYVKYLDYLISQNQRPLLTMITSLANCFEQTEVFLSAINQTHKIEKIKNYFDRLDINKIDIAEEKTPIANTTLTILSSMAFTAESTTPQLRQNILRAELEYFKFNKVCLQPDPEGFEPEWILGFDIDDTLWHEVMRPNNIVLIEEARLLYLLTHLKPNTKVVAITSRYYPESSNIQTSALDVISKIHRLLGSSIFSEIYYTSANDKGYCILAQNKKYYFNKPASFSKQVVLIDNIENNLTVTKALGFSTILATKNGDHLSELHTLMNIPEEKNENHNNKRICLEQPRIR